MYAFNQYLNDTNMGWKAKINQDSWEYDHKVSGCDVWDRGLYPWKCYTEAALEAFKYPHLLKRDIERLVTDEHGRFPKSEKGHRRPLVDLEMLFDYDTGMFVPDRIDTLSELCKDPEFLENKFYIPHRIEGFPGSQYLSVRDTIVVLWKSISEIMYNLPRTNISFKNSNYFLDDDTSDLKFLGYRICNRMHNLPYRILDNGTPENLQNFYVSFGYKIEDIIGENRGCLTDGAFEECTGKPVLPYKVLTDGFLVPVSIPDIQEKWLRNNSNIKCISYIKTNPCVLIVSRKLDKKVAQKCANYAELMELTPLTTDQNYKIIKFNLDNFQAES